MFFFWKLNRLLKQLYVLGEKCRLNLLSLREEYEYEFLKVITVKTKKNFSRRKILRARWVYVLVVNLIYRESITNT